MENTETVDDLQGLTQDNIGDVLIFGYADYLRRYDTLTTQMEALNVAADEKLVEGAKPFTDAIHFDRIRRLSVEEINALPVEEAASNALAKSQILLGAAALLKIERTASPGIRIKENGDLATFTWPINHRVRIEDTTPDQRIINRLVVSSGPDKALVKSRRKNPSVIEGKLWIADSAPKNGGMLRLMKKPRGPWNAYNPIDVGPIIDRENDYTANIKLTVLD